MHVFANMCSFTDKSEKEREGERERVQACVHVHRHKEGKCHLDVHVFHDVRGPKEGVNVHVFVYRQMYVRVFACVCLHVCVRALARALAGLPMTLIKILILFFVSARVEPFYAFILRQDFCFF